MNPRHTKRGVVGYSRTTFTFVAILAISLVCAGQTEVSADRIMESARALQKSAKRAGDLQPDAKRYCNPGPPRIDASDLEDAISSRLLKNHSWVPAHIRASSMWYVSFVAVDLISELDSVGSHCAIAGNYSVDAARLFQDYSSVWLRFENSITEFWKLAVLQTQWEEGQNLEVLVRGERDSSFELKNQLQAVLLGASAIKRTVDEADRFDREYLKRSDCLPCDLPSDTYPGLSELISRIEQGPDRHFLFAVEMANAFLDASTAEMVVEARGNACRKRAGEKRKARKAAQEIQDAHFRLARSIVEFEPLITRQAEWEESILQESALGEEH